MMSNYIQHSAQLKSGWRLTWCRWSNRRDVLQENEPSTNRFLCVYVCVFVCTPGPVIGDLEKRGGPTLSLSVPASEPQSNAELPELTWEWEGPNLPGRARAQHEPPCESAPKHKLQPWLRPPFSGTPLEIPKKLVFCLILNCLSLGL